MRVLHVIPSIAACYGGPSKVVLDTCLALRNAGIDAEIATTNADEDGDIPIPAELPANVNNVPVFFFARQNRWRYKFSWNLTSWLKQNVPRYDLLHIHALFSYSTAAAAFYARKFNVPYIMLPHGMLGPWPVRNKRLLKSIYLKAVEKKNLTRAAAVHFSADDELRTSIVAGRANFVLPYILNLGTHRDHVLRSNSHSRVRILYLSRIDPKKGIELLIQAAGKLADERNEFELVIAGTGEPSYEEKVKSMVRADERLAALTKFVGFTRGAEKAALLESSDIFILPSNDENFGIAIAEAMAAELPVIVSDRVNIHEEIKKAGAGLVVSPAVDSVLAALRKLLSEPLLRSDMGRKGAELVKNRFSPAVITRETLTVYADVIRNSRESSSWRTTSRI